MTSLDRDRLRGGGAVFLAALVCWVTVQPAAAAVPAASPTAPAPTTATDETAGTPDQATPATDQPPPAPTPQLQLQDDGPGAGDSDVARVSRRRTAAVDDPEERPFWKHWLFWGVTGALVVGAVGMIVYTASGSDTSLAPCPVDASLGCFGSGRAQ